MALPRPPRWCTLSAFLLALAAARASAQDPAQAPLFPFVLPWDDAGPGIADVGKWNETPAGAHGPIVVKAGHLHAGPRRIRLLGVNLCFGANFPTHDDAARVAARLAKFGINCVRFHHMDMLTAPDGLFAADRRTLDPGQLDKLDFFIARLKERGIYADLNLHVSRTYPDQPTWPGMPDFHKGVDNLIPRMIEWQREYARDLLTHRNPYTRSTYAAEPAVALVEINNENGLIHAWWNGHLAGLPAPLADEFSRQWNAWLSTRYPDFDALKRAWGSLAAPLGSELLANRDFAQGLQPWYFEQHGDARADAQPTADAPGGGHSVRVRVERPGREGWHVQLSQAKLSLRKGAPYTLQFRARADAPSSVIVLAAQDHDPWRVLQSTTVRLTTDWQDFRLTLAPTDDEAGARICFSGLGTRAGSTWFADVSLRPGGTVGLRAGDRPGHVGILATRDDPGRTEAARLDWVRFLWDAERRYWTGMYRFLKDDLKVKALVLGTQAGWSPSPIQDGLDVIDSHAYWHHPRFPGGGWDEEHWTVENTPMAGIPGGGTLPGLALSRVAGKPFLCTEYNHSAPNTYSSEAYPLLAAFAGLQDWDGIFAFAYSHRRDDWDARRIPGFFDIDQHPAKMVTLPASAALFRRFDLPAPDRPRAAEPRDPIAHVLRSGPYLGADAFGLERAEALRVPVGLSLRRDPESHPAPSPHPLVRPGFRWGEPGGKQVATIDTPRSQAVIGSVGESAHVVGDTRIAFGPTRQGWAAVTLTAMDGPDLRSPGHILVTATGYVENTAMGWKDASHTTVGRDWGRAPTLVEGIPATISLPVPSSLVRAWSLDERGLRHAPLSVRDDSGRAAVPLGPQHRTLWYELEIRPRK